MRALDLEDRNWVTGFGKRWQGQLSTTQRQAMRQARIDETFLGARDVPFTLAQTDLLAAHLAHEMSCTMQQARMPMNTSSPRTSANRIATGLQGTVELISNNLANRQALTLSSDEPRTNAVLSGKAHQIDGVLFQYWLTVTPQKRGRRRHGAQRERLHRAAGERSCADSTCVRNPVRPKRRSRGCAGRVSIPNAGKDSLISPLRIASPDSLSDCRDGGVAIREASYMSGVRPCSLLQTEAHADSIVFFLEHQANHGLVRLAGTECRDRTKARIARSGELLSFPIAKTTTAKQNWSETYEWLLEPDLDTYYAVVISDAQLARRVANHIDNLPLRCSASIRPGLEGNELRDWLSDFAMMTARSSQARGLARRESQRRTVAEPR